MGYRVESEMASMIHLSSYGNLVPSQLPSLTHALSLNQSRTPWTLSAYSGGLMSMVLQCSEVLSVRSLSA